jgi:hypothetical protein
MLFDKEGILNIDELVAQRPTFRKIMEDQIVTDDELTNQANLVVNLLKKLEQTLSPGQLSEVENLLAEMSVLYAIHQYKEIQDLKARLWERLNQQRHFLLHRRLFRL